MRTAPGETDLNSSVQRSGAVLRVLMRTRSWKQALEEFLAADGLCRVRTAQVDDAAAAMKRSSLSVGDVHGAAVEMHRGVDMRAHVRRHVDRRDVGNSAVVDALVPEDLERRVAREYGRSGAYGRGNVPKAAHAVAS